MTRYMSNFYFFSFLISMAVLIRARDTPSTIPSTYICPPTNTLGLPLGNSDVTSNPIFCAYPLISGVNPNGLYCTYSRTTGVLVTNHDLGLCPANAVKATVMSKNRHNAHAPLPTRPKNVVRGIPDTAPPKRYLKKRRPSSTVVFC
ncbi:hypothetical protein BJ912DRAFT_603221 [Pholiota molesta]|nr:hypothetical protein BJ912DRAFT_603221 [Pholiota molesta]